MHYQAIQHMPIMLTKVEFDLNYFILYKDIFLEPLTYKRRKKTEKVTHFFLSFLKQLMRSNLNNNFKKLHAVST